MKWGIEIDEQLKYNTPDLSSVKSSTLVFLWNRQIFEQSGRANGFSKAFAFGIKKRKFPVSHRPSYEELEKRFEELEEEALMRKRAEEALQ